MKANHHTLDKHVALFTAFATRVSALAPSAWTRIEARCAALSGPSFGALLSRARLTAKSHELWLPEGAQRSGRLRALKVASDVIGHGFAFTMEILAEFDAASEAVAPVRPIVGTVQADPPAMSPRVTALVEAHRRLEAVLRPRMQRHPGVIAAVRAAGEAVLRHDWLTPAAFAALYQYVAPEIPFTSLEPPTGPTAATHTIT